MDRLQCFIHVYPWEAAVLLHWSFFRLLKTAKRYDYGNIFQLLIVCCTVCKSCRKFAKAVLLIRLCLLKLSARLFTKKSKWYKLCRDLLLQVLPSLFRRLTIMLDHLLFSAILLTLPYFVHYNHSVTSENQDLLLRPRHAFPSINPSVIFIIKSPLDPRKMWPKYASFLFASAVDSGTVLLSFSLIDLFVVCSLQLIFNVRLYVHISKALIFFVFLWNMSRFLIHRWPLS